MRPSDTSLFESVKRSKKRPFTSNIELIASTARGQRIMSRFDVALVEALKSTQKIFPGSDSSLLKAFIALQKELPNLSQELIESINFAKRAISPGIMMSMGTSKKETFIEYSKYIEVLQKIDTMSKFDSAHELDQIRQKINKVTKFDLAHSPDKKEKSDPSIVVNEASHLKTIITDIFSDNKKILLLESRQFEEIIGELLRSQGFDVDLTKRTRDGGYDIMAIKKIDRHSPMKFLVECKRYSTQKIGVEIIRQFMYVVNKENANRGIIATTSYFTKDAMVEKTANPYLLDYKDRDDVMDWIRTYCTEKRLS